MATKMTLISRIGGSIKRAKGSVKRAKGYVAGAKKVARKVVTRLKNPSAEARAAVAGKWAEWAIGKGMAVGAIKNGLYVLKTMPDPTRVKNFSDIAKAVGHRVANPRKLKRKALPAKKTALRKASSTGNWAVAEKVGEGKFKIIGWTHSQSAAIHDAEISAEKKNKQYAVLSRAKVVSLRRH